MRWTAGEAKATLRVVGRLAYGNRLDTASTGARAEPRSRRLTGRRRSVLPALRDGAAELPRLARPRRRLAGRHDHDVAARRQGRRARGVRPGPRGRRVLGRARRRRAPDPPRAPLRAAPRGPCPAAAGEREPARGPRRRPRSRRPRPRQWRRSPPPPLPRRPANASPQPARNPGPVEETVQTGREVTKPLLPPVVQEPVQPVLDTVQAVGKTVDDTVAPLLPTLP